MELKQHSVHPLGTTAAPDEVFPLQSFGSWVPSKQKFSQVLFIGCSLGLESPLSICKALCLVFQTPVQPSPTLGSLSQRRLRSLVITVTRDKTI